ncbi:amino acid ABC transporter permease [Janibacter cremeus]|uniref:Glutamate transport system permease protein n=1 Tax=Janibacter cremeus TaxID=1285192 RepID=A0A852VST2_9MICO|nr:amino acid ABC transporter permease [Janibacter cremeus]NYF99366.1 glutamate transport system permease protein [Janibacter cremeus]
MSTVLFDTPGPRTLARQRIYTVIAVLVIAALLAAALRQLWTKEMITPDQWEAFGEPRILMALLEELILGTLAAAVVAILFAVTFGAVFAAGRLSDRAWIRLPSRAIVEFFRAVPVLLMIFVAYFGFGSTLGLFWSLVLALTLYNGSVLAEIFRAGIQAVPTGQSEAAYAIGMTKSQVMVQILAPQAVRSMLPAIISQCVVALKDTTLGFAIGAPGIVDVGERIYLARVYNNPFAVGIVLAAVFIIINYSLSKLAVYLESRMRQQGTKALHLVDAGGGGG